MDFLHPIEDVSKFKYPETLLLDLDGTIRCPKSDSKLINDPEDQKPIDGAIEAIKLFKDNGTKFVIGVSNQGGIETGYKTMDSALKEMNITIRLFSDLDAILFCPDMFGKVCFFVSREPVRVFTTYNDSATKKVAEKQKGNYRKPGYVMLRLAHFITRSEPEDCLMVGDKTEDKIAAFDASIKFMWANTWRGLVSDS